MSLTYLSHYLNDKTPGFGGQKSFFTESKSKITEGRSSNSLQISLFNHTGTHMDLPYHFDEKGKKLSDYPADEWSFNEINVLNIEVKPGEIIDLRQYEERISESCELLLLKTNFEKYREQAIYWQNNPGLSVESGDFLKTKFPNIRCIGFDFISLTAFHHRELGRKAHSAFLGSTNGRPICIIEDMKLSNWSINLNRVIVAPLLVHEADGVPVTVLAYS